jgi:hypothetical protein
LRPTAIFLATVYSRRRGRSSAPGRDNQSLIASLFAAP